MDAIYIAGNSILAMLPGTLLGPKGGFGTQQGRGKPRQCHMPSYIKFIHPYLLHHVNEEMCNFSTFKRNSLSQIPTNV